jgi:hypothetical protein
MKVWGLFVLNLQVAFTQDPGEPNGKEITSEVDEASGCN